MELDARREAVSTARGPDYATVMALIYIGDQLALDHRCGRGVEADLIRGADDES